MEDFKDAMRPTKTDRVVNIPITFSKRSEGAVSGKTLFWVLLTVTILFIILVVGVLTGGASWYIKYPVSLLLIYLFVFFLRFFVFREGRLSDAFETMKEKDYQQSTNIFWNIYDIKTKPPYIVHYANGLKGVFVRFDKDVIVGKEDYMEYRHFEGISNMYNEAHKLGLDMVSIDYMDSVGNDERMSKVHTTASNVTNPDLKAILISLYSNLEHEMQLDYTSFDVYLFTTRDKEEDLWYNVRQVIEYGLKANFKSYSLIKPEDLRKMAQVMMNLETFSLTQAEKEVISSTLSQRIRPIKVINDDGSERIINKTREQLEKEKEFKEQQRKNNKVKKNVKENRTEELTDLFEGTSVLDAQWSDEDNKKKKRSKDEELDDEGMF